MKISRSHHGGAVAVLAGVVLLSGCAARTGAPSAIASVSGQARAGKNVGVLLQRGMTPGDVRALLGEPRSIKPFRQAGIQNEVWTYTRTIATTTTTESTRTRQVPFFDPFLNDVRMIDEPVYQPLEIDLNETISLLFIEGQLAEWKTTRETERDYN